MNVLAPPPPTNIAVTAARPGLERVLIVTDAWAPQVNGVVRTLSTTAAELRRLGHTVDIIGPDRFRTIPCPTYPEIRLSLFPRRRLARLIEGFMPCALHIATEGPLGIAARRWALRNGQRFTTAFHTRFPDYLQARTRIPARITYAWLRRFHRPSAGLMVATPSLAADLGARGFRNIKAWSRGVDTKLFRPALPGEAREDWGLPRPIFLYVGRVAVEKNIRAFLDLDLPGSKVVVGDGPQLAALRRDYAGVHFAGARFGAELARAYAGADVFVFPSRTDTFGLVIIEALACGTPVAAYPVTGPIDIITDPAVGATDTDLRAAALRALDSDRAACRLHAELYSWQATTEMFLGNLVEIDGQQASPWPASSAAATG